jgi:adenylate kinase
MVEGVCDDCNGTLVQRKDDHPDTVLARLNIYHNETEPLVDYYRQQGKLVDIEGLDDVDLTTSNILKIIEG